MESAEYSLDELLCQSLLLFRQYRFYDAPECGEKAFRILEEAHVWMGRTQECVDMAKWGCVIECLAQKYYIEDDTDAILEEIDAALVAHWKRIEKIHAEVTTVYLWLGYYFLLRFRNRESRSHSRCKQIMSSLLLWSKSSVRWRRGSPDRSLVTSFGRCLGRDRLLDGAGT